MRTITHKLRLAMLLPLMPALTACPGSSEIQVRPADPLPPPCLTIPRAVLEPVKLPTWLQSPKLSSVTSPKQRCMPQSPESGQSN